MVPHPHLTILAMSLAVASGAPIAIYSDNNVLCEITIFDRCHSMGSCRNDCAVLPECLSGGAAGGFYYKIPWTRTYECRDHYGYKITFVDCQKCQNEPNSASLEPKVPIAKTPLWNSVIVTVQTSVWNTYVMALCAAAMMILAAVMCFRNRRFCSKDNLKSGVLLTP